MLTEDYIMRMISQALAVFMTALGLKRSKKYKEALQVFNQALGGILGLDPSLVDQLDDSALLTMLTNQGKLDLARLTLLADIYREQSELYSWLGQPDENLFAARRSLRLYLEAFLASELIPDRELIDKIEALRHMLPVPTLPADTRLALMDYIDRLLTQNDDSLSILGLLRTSLQADISSLDSLEI